MLKVLFVCMGNICRSPTAHGVFRHLVTQQQLTQQIYIDSAGTHAYHVGSPPDQRAQEAARMRGIILEDLRARQVQAKDFIEFDYILAMDEENYQNLQRACPPEQRHKIHYMTRFIDDDEQAPKEVPDPYYGGAQGFEYVLDLVESAAQGLLAELRKKL